MIKKIRGGGIETENAIEGKEREVEERSTGAGHKGMYKLINIHLVLRYCSLCITMINRQFS